MAAPHLSPAIIAGDFVFLSGQIAFDLEGRVEGDIAAQTELCLARLETVLQAQGLDRSAIVKTTVWLTSAGDFSAFNTAYAEFFGNQRPARSTVVAALAIPTALVEIEAIARTFGPVAS